MNAEPTQLAGARQAAASVLPGNDQAGSSATGAKPSASSKRVLEPIERISEVLFGLIMVLTFTCSFSVAEAGRSEVRGLLVGALGCNLAWGIIDAIMYLMGCLADKARALATVRAVRKTKNQEKAQALIAESLPVPVASALSSRELELIRQHLQQLADPLAAPRLARKDWVGAVAVFILVVLSTLPVVLPFAFMQNAMHAQRVSNAIAIGLLFLTGYAFGRCTGYHPRGMGIAMVVIGGVLVGITILLGG